MAELARQKNTHPVDLMIDMALERDMKFFMIQPIANEDQAEALELMKHPRSVVTFSDSGRPRLADHGQLAADASARATGCARSRPSRWRRR